MIPSKQILSKLKTEIYRNTVRLFCDACLLYRHKSFPSAYAFSILSIEELGKLEMVDHICDDISINPGINTKEFLKHLFSKDMFFSHRNKQMWASDPFVNIKRKRLNEIDRGIIERTKQNALYVGYSNRRIRSPQKITSIKAYAELAIVYKKLMQIEDLGFNGFDCISNYVSKDKGKRYISKIEKIFKKLKKYRKR